MKILVTVKRVVDYNVKVHALADHTGPDTAAAKMSMNPFDEIAVEKAVRLKEEGKADEVVAVSVGGAKTVDTLRVAMAMGADRAIHITTEDVVDPAAAAELFAAVVKNENPDLVLMGKQAIDDDAAQTRDVVRSFELAVGNLRGCGGIERAPTLGAPRNGRRAAGSCVRSPGRGVGGSSFGRTSLRDASQHDEGQA